jgi:hypothetical protein
MDPDQDLLDRIDSKERGGLPATAALVVGIALLAGIIGYLTFKLEFNSRPELALDGGGLIGAVTAVALLVFYIRLSNRSRSL